MAIQSKLHSLLESLTQVSVGYIVAIASQFLIFPYFGIDVSTADHLLIGICFLTISLIRSYLLRRFWTKRTE